MSLLRSQASSDLALGALDATQAAASSGVLEDYGNYIGGTLSLLWSGLAVYSIYLIWNLDESKDKNKKYMYAGPGIALLIVFIANAYYYKSKDKSEEELKSVKSIYANITLSPIYLIIAGIVIMFLAYMK